MRCLEGNTNDVMNWVMEWKKRKRYELPTAVNYDVMMGRRMWPSGMSSSPTTAYV